MKVYYQKNITFNSKKIMGNCEVCKKKIGTEVHHLQHQENANENNMIKSFIKIIQQTY